ncbi:MAG: DUF4957 domain-containing protein [Bacteroidales bacterium]|nr:DUF4957 domain-containing protein [Bacteroidales bacterium]
MKKFFTSFAILAALMSVQAMADTTVSTKADLEAAIKAAAGSGQETETVINIAAGSYISMTNGFEWPLDCNITINGLTDEEHPDKPVLTMQTKWATANTEGTATNLHFNNLQLECTGGRTASSKYMFRINTDFEVFIGDLHFTNCDFTNYNRAIFRCDPVAHDIVENEETISVRCGGEINSFKLNGCKFFDGYSQNNPMALWYFGMRIIDADIQNNLCYNMGYMHSFFTFAYMTDYSVADIQFTMKNNTFVCRPQNTFMTFTNFVGQSSVFNIENNFFLEPNWRDEYNNMDITDDMLAAVPDTLSRLPHKTLASIRYGMGTISNNVLEQFGKASNSLDADGDGEWSVDTLNWFSFEDVDFGWDKFTDAQGGLFGIWNQERVFTAGTNGEPIGALSQYVADKQEVVALNVSIEGSESAEVTVTPNQAKYLKGDVVTVTVDTKGLNEVVSWSNGMTGTTNEITLEEDLDLVITCKEIPYLAIWNFQQITKNSTAVAADLVPNFAKDGYKDIQIQMVQYVDSLGGYTTEDQSLQTRGNKMGKPCIIVRDSLYNVAAGHVAYLQVVIPKVETGMTFSAEIGTENYMTKVTNLEASEDGTNWTVLNKIELDTPNSNTWNALSGSLDAFAGKENVIVRIKGVEESGYWIGSDVIDLAESEGVDPEEKLTFYFPYYTNFQLLGAADTAIELVEAGEKNAAAVRYDLSGRRISKVQGGLQILNGKVIFVK